MQGMSLASHKYKLLKTATGVHGALSADYKTACMIVPEEKHSIFK